MKRFVLEISERFFDDARREEDAFKGLTDLQLVRQMITDWIFMNVSVYPEKYRIKIKEMK